MSGIGMFLLGAGSSLVNIADKSISDSDFTVTPTNAESSSRYELGNDGVARFFRNKGTSGTYAGEWLVGGSPSDYEVRFSLLSGSVSGGTLNTWLSLATTRNVNVSALRTTIGETTVSGTVLVEIRTTSGLILDSATVVLSATSTVTS